MSKLKTVDDILQTEGDTPLIRLNRVAPENGSQLYGKLEARNPAGSVKDRIGASMIRAAEADGQLNKGMTIVEPTSGNTGIALAMAAAALGYRLVLTMPESMRLERRQVMASYGAQIVLTPGAEDMPGAIAKAEELKVADPDGVFIPQQFANPANPAAHRDTTALEILEAMAGRLDAFVVGVGTGGTMTGVGSVLKKEVPNVRLVAVEPKRSPVLSGGEAALHGIQGIGAGFVPEILDRDLIDPLRGPMSRPACRSPLRWGRMPGWSPCCAIRAFAISASTALSARRIHRSSSIFTAWRIPPARMTSR